VAGKLLAGGNQVRIVLPEKNLHEKPWDGMVRICNLKNNERVTCLDKEEAGNLSPV